MKQSEQNGKKADLKMLQESFQAYIVDNNPVILANIVDEHAPAEQRLAIYQNAYLARLIETLIRVYPMLFKWIGDEQFNEWARGYIEAYPSTHHSIKQFTKNFSLYLSNLAESNVAFVELAQFEWALEQSMDAADVDLIEYKDLAAISPELWAQLQLIFHPSVSVHQFTYNIPTIWQALQEGRNLDKQFELARTYCIVWRKKLQNFYALLSYEQYIMLNGIKNGSLLSDICELLYDLMPEETIIQFVAENIRGWAEEGVFSGFIV